MLAMSAFHGSEMEGPEISHMHTEQLKLTKAVGVTVSRTLVLIPWITSKPFR